MASLTNTKEEPSDDPQDEEIDLIENEGEKIRMKRITEIKDHESATNWKKVGVIFLVWAIIFFLQLSKGGHGAPSVIGVQQCSIAWWVLTVLSFPIIIIITGWIGYYLVKDYNEKVVLGWEFREGDLKWNRKNTVYYPAYSFIAGIAAGLMGIGGGMVKGPILLEMGVPAIVQSATSSFMILFTSSATTFQFMILGLLPYDYSIWYFIWGFASTYVGNIYINYLVKKYKKTIYYYRFTGFGYRFKYYFIGYLWNTKCNSKC